MNLYHLKAFFTVARVKSFTQAAEILFVTQSAVSHALKKLENSVDTVLLLKQGKKIVLTEAGRSLFRSCEKIFYEIEKADMELQHYRKKAIYKIFMGSPVEFGTTILLRHIRSFLAVNPDIHLDFLFSHHLIDSLLEDRLDVIIDCKKHQHPDLDVIALFRETYVTIASPEFIKQNNIRELDDLEKINILSVDKGLEWWGNFLISIPEEKHACLKNVIQINHVRGLINGAISGIGIGFVPRYTVLQELENHILVDPFPQIKPAADYFNIYIKKTKKKFPKYKLLIDYLTWIQPSEFGSEE